MDICENFGQMRKLNLSILMISLILMSITSWIKSVPLTSTDTDTLSIDNESIGKRYSEFLGGPGKKSSIPLMDSEEKSLVYAIPNRYLDDTDGLVKRWSEFLGGPGKRYQNTSPGFLLAKKVVQLLKPKNNEITNKSFHWRKIQPSGSEFLGGPGR